MNCAASFGYTRTLMSQRFENPLTFRTLYESPNVRLQDYCCRIGRSGPAAEEYSSANEIVLMRRGAFCQHYGRRSVMADVNQAVFFSKGVVYRVSHPADCGDRGVVFAPSPNMLRDLLRELDPASDDRPEQPFPFTAGPCDAGAFWRHYELARRLRSEATDPIWAEVTSLQLVAGLLEAAFAQHGLLRKPRRKDTIADHIDRVEAAKSYLATRLGERLTLDDVAGSAGASPFHLARIFQQRTGMPVHRYLVCLRLRAALEQLAEGVDDLTALAFELGFASHSHFTTAFRREFGHTPSEVRHASVRRLREMSKNLKV
jgi:AraC-like DNA-binding protein